MCFDSPTKCEVSLGQRLCLAESRTSMSPRISKYSPGTTRQDLQHEVVENWDFSLTDAQSPAFEAEKRVGSRRKTVRTADVR